jgi:hypothetical protein
VTAPPGDAEQLAFLGNIQRILDEGQFVATYKFALLLALVEIAVERGDDSGAPVAIHLDAIAEKFLELYWDHTRPFASHVLRQNTGRNIAILGEIEELQIRWPRISDARRTPAWSKARRRTAGIIRAMPLFRLQLLRGNYRLPFLYDETMQQGQIVLKPGVAFCLRRFSTMIGSLARNAWLAAVRSNPQNAYLAGGGESLEAFLFGQERIDLTAIREVVWDLQNGRCFYCDGRMSGTPQVDHFVPWACYPSNLGHNLVLAHAGCNADKSDLLADVRHLERWWYRNEHQGSAIEQALTVKGLITDLPATQGITAWAYRRARAAGSLLWSAKGDVHPFPVGTTLPFEAAVADRMHVAGRFAKP